MTEGIMVRPLRCGTAWCGRELGMRPVWAFLIEHPRGRVLVDSGWTEEVRDEAAGLHRLGRMLWRSLQPQLPPGQSISEQLARLGLTAADLDTVVFTHLDADQAGGARALAGARRLLVNEAELLNAYRKSRYRPALWERAELAAVQMQGLPYGPYRAAYDLFGDESLVLVFLPGHSWGTTGVLVRREGRQLLLASDSPYGTAPWPEITTLGASVDRRGADQSRQWLDELAADPSCLGVWGGHDLELTAVEV